MQIVNWPVAKFAPYERTLRKNDPVVGRMVASIQEFGFKIPILVRSSGEIVDGHLRLKAAQQFALTAESAPPPPLEPVSRVGDL